MIDIIEGDSNSEDSQFKVEFPLSTVAKALADAVPSDRILIYGHATHEEYTSYARSLTPGPIPTFFWTSVRSYLYENPKASSKSVDRVGSFLSNRAGAAAFGVGSDKFVEHIATLSQEALIEIIARQYVKSRRKKEGAADEISGHLTYLLQTRVKGQLTVIDWSFYLNYIDLLAIWLWGQGTPSGPLVVLGSDFGDTNFFNKRIERRYITPSDLIKAAATKLRISEDAVRGAYSVYARTSLRLLVAQRRTGLSLREAAGFVDVLASGDLDAITSDESPIPIQRAAPLRFQVENNRLDVLREQEHDVKEPKILGAARTAIALAEDLRSLGGYSNIIPTFYSRLDRVCALLASVLDQAYDDALIVQLGTEATALQRRVEDSKSQLGEILHADAVGFFAMVESFLSQFQVWLNYSEAAKEVPQQGAAEAAGVVLEIAAADHTALTVRARTRVGNYVEGSNLDGSIADPAGTTRSAENMVASAVGSIVEEAKAEGGQLADAVRAKLRDQSATGISGLIARNSGALLNFAAKNGMKWFQDWWNTFS